MFIFILSFVASIISTFSNASDIISDKNASHIIVRCQTDVTECCHVICHISIFENFEFLLRFSFYMYY